MACYRTKYIDPEYSRNPKTEIFCWRCQRDLKPGQRVFYIAYELDTLDAIHKDDLEIALLDIKKRRANHLDSFVVSPVGSECAKKIGVDFILASPSIPHRKENNDNPKGNYPRNF